MKLLCSCNVRWNSNNTLGLNSATVTVHVGLPFNKRVHFIVHLWFLFCTTPHVPYSHTVNYIHPAVNAPTKPPPVDLRELHHLCRKFATTFTELAEILNTSVEIFKLKEFLESYCHPLYPEQPYVAPKIYGNATTTKEVLKSLFPQYINYMHYYLLENIVVKFGCDRAKEVLQQYTDQMYSRKRKLNDLPGPITDGEIEQFHGTKKLKVQVEGDTSDATVEIIGEVQKALEKAIVA